MPVRRQAKWFLALSLFCGPASSAAEILEHVAQRHPGPDWCTKLRAMPGAATQLQILYQTEIAKNDDLRSTRLVMQLLAGMKCVGGKDKVLREAADQGPAKTRKFADHLLKNETPVEESPRDGSLKIRVKRSH